MDKNNFRKQISIKEQKKQQEEENKLAQKLLNYEIFPQELTEVEAEAMKKYFIKDIKEKDKELEKIKNHILSMKKQLEKVNNKS